MSGRATPSRPSTLLVMSPEVYDIQFGPEQRARLQQLASLAEPVAVSSLDPAVVGPRLTEVEVLLTSWGCPRLTPETLATMPRLRAVLHAAGSVRAHVGQEVFDRGLLVTTAASQNAEPVAQYTLAAVLWAFKQVPFLAASARQRDGLGFQLSRGALSGRHRTVVVIGFSRVGRRVVELLGLTSSSRLLVVDPVVDPALVRAAGAEPVELAEALAQADVVSVHAPLLPATRGMLGAAELALLPDGATLVNTARGGLVDTAALEQECRTGRLHAVLDVTEPEPLPLDSPLYDLPNVVLTPHVAGSLGSETQLMAEAALTELERLAAGLPPREPVTREGLVVQA